MDGEFGQPADPSLGTDRFPRSKKSQRPQGFGLDRSLQQQRTSWNHRDRDCPRRIRLAGAVLREGALHASPQQAGADQPGEARSFRHAHAGNRFGDSAELRSGRAVAEAMTWSSCGCETWGSVPARPCFSSTVNRYRHNSTASPQQSPSGIFPSAALSLTILRGVV